MRLFQLAGLVVLCLSTLSCHGETAEEMISSCRAISTAKVTDGKVALPEDFNSGVCWGAFAMAQKMTRFFYDKSGTTPIFGICAPSKSTRTQLIQVFEQYATRHPERYHEDFWVVAQDALHEAFPCKG
jgi:hypothetical protein